MVFLLKTDLIPKLHLSKLNVLLSTMVTIMVTMCFVGKGSGNVRWQDAGSNDNYLGILS